MRSSGYRTCKSICADYSVCTGNQWKNSTGDRKIHTHFFDVQLEEDGIGIDWHPSLRTHEKMSETLINKIKEVMKW